MQKIVGSSKITALWASFPFFKKDQLILKFCCKNIVNWTKELQLFLQDLAYCDAFGLGVLACSLFYSVSQIAASAFEGHIIDIIISGSNHFFFLCTVTFSIQKVFPSLYMDIKLCYWRWDIFYRANVNSKRDLENISQMYFTKFLFLYY